MASTYNASSSSRIEDPTNIWFFDPAAVAAIPAAIRLGISANVVSFIGLFAGAMAAWAYAHWSTHYLAFVGLMFSMLWLTTDSLDGKLARATNTCSAFGRELDGMCDYGVFIMIYCALAGSIGTRTGWMLAVAGGVAHAMQASLYEAERGRFYRRLNGDMHVEAVTSKNPLVRLYDGFTAIFSDAADRFDHIAARRERPAVYGQTYATAAAPLIRMMVPLTQNSRVFVIFISCLCRDPQLFWWFELVPLTLLLAITLLRLRRLEYRILTRAHHAPVLIDA